MKAPNDLPSIRTASLDDVARIRSIARAAYAKYVLRIGHEPAPMAADYEGEVSARRVVVIDVDGSVSGYMVAWPEADAYFIDNIGIEPKAQGKGLGRRLIKHAAAEAYRLHLPALRLYTNAAMTENLSMYTYLGFVETRRVVEKGFNRIYMRLALAENQP
jgi:GNAT superfamily N-acetyltransferase